MARTELTRQRLVRAALELFTTQGYHPTTTPQLAKRAGIAEGTIYRHFSGKRQLLSELYRGAGRWATRLAREADAAAGPPRDKLARLGDLLSDGAVREPAVVRLFFLQDVSPLLDDRAREAAREFRAALEGVVAQGKAEGIIRPGGVDVLAAAWLGVIRVALERIVTREWGSNSAGVAVCVTAAWHAIAAEAKSAGEPGGDVPKPAVSTGTTGRAPPERPSRPAPVD
jgi:AcrR family transcriptional regulator